MSKNRSKVDVKVDENSRLLEYLRRKLSDIPAGKIKKYLEHRQISVDGVYTTKFDYPLKPGQIISINPAKTAPSSPLEVIFEDDYLLVINKPAGLLSVATDKEKEKTAYRMLKDSMNIPLYVVHRIDRDTSGVLIFAKSEEIKDALQNNWDNTLKREYLAICEGVFEDKKGRCDTFLRETEGHFVYSSKTGEGKRAVTNYEVIKENKNYSFVRLLIETGRKNQIRVHMKELGHPIAGDKKYGAETNPLKRLGLHAGTVELFHPVTKKILILKAKANRRFTLPYEVKDNPEIKNKRKKDYK